MRELPTILFTTVIRATDPGESHGGVYKLNLETEKVRQMIDWDDVSINWAGRGGDRGMRGIAFFNNHIYIAIADEVLKFDNDLNLIERFTNQYLSSIHEITTRGSSLFISSTPRGAIIEFDLEAEEFVWGVNLRPPVFNYLGFLRENYTTYLRKLAQFVATPLITNSRLQTFDPKTGGGPKEYDLLHLNTVFGHNKELFVSGTTLPYIFTLNKSRIKVHANIPRITHNPQPYKDGIILNDTGDDTVAFYDKEGKREELYKTPTYPESDLTHTDVSKNQARQGFGRGLCTLDNLVISGSSPATISVYDFMNKKMLKQIQIEKDMRSAVHGLEIWPH